MKIIPIIFLVFILSLNLYSFNLVSSDSDTIQNTKFNKFIELVEKKAETEWPWIERKEIASWAALIVYLSILMIFSKGMNYLRKLTENWKLGFSILIISLMVLFMLFIFKQFGSMASSMAYQQIKYNWIFRSIDNKEKALSDFNCIIDSDKSLEQALKEQSTKIAQSEIRKYRWCYKPAVPIMEIGTRICGYETNMSTVEVEEFALYDIMILLTIIFIIYIWIKPEDSQEALNNSTAED